jgi:DNA mismatch repair ATPase MutS
MCFAATHDIELTHLLEKDYTNYHFTEEVKDNNVIFSYVIQDGRATSRNAIKLLEIIGYDKEIIKKAEDKANDFIKNGVWRQN